MKIFTMDEFTVILSKPYAGFKVHTYNSVCFMETENHNWFAFYVLFSFLCFAFTGVEVRGLEVVTNDYSVLKENDAYNRIMFDMTAITTRDSGGIYGDNLWDLTLYGSQSENGMGLRFNEQKGAFSKYQTNKDAYPGENIEFGMVDTNFNMQGLSCKDVRYLCAELTQGPKPNPPFEFTPVPNANVLKKCFRQKCDGEF